jgi:hypothetical protein
MSWEPQSQLSIPAKTRLAWEVTRTYRRTRRLVDRDNLPGVLAQIRGEEAEGAAAPVSLQEGFRLGRAVAKTLTRLPADSRCLMQSLVLTAMLARRGTPSVLVIGVQPGESLGAHAWVELGGVPLLPTGDDQFARLTEL